MKKKHYISLIIVLGGLAVIFVPMLNEKSFRLLHEEISFLSAPAAKKSKENRIQESAHALRQVPVNITSGAAHRVVARTEDFPQAWVVNVARLSNPDGVKDMVTLLEKNSFKVFTRVQPSNGINQTQVFVGPEINKESAVRLQEKVNELLTMNTQLEPYDPIALAENT